MIKDSDLQAQVDALRADVQRLRDQLSSGVGLPDFAPATNGDLLAIDGGFPTWKTLPAPVTSISVNAPITSTGGTTPTIGHAASGVTANTYNFPSQIVVNGFGHITSATDGSSALNGAFNSKANLAGGNAFTGAQTFSSSVGISGTLTLPGSSGQYVRGDGSRATFPSIPSGTVTSVAAGNGMNFSTFTGSGSATLGTPSTLTPATSNALTTNSHTHAVTGFMPTTGGAFSGGITGTTASFSGAITQTSDARFKTDIVDLRNGIEIIRACLPRCYFNLLSGDQEAGFVAQELREAFPAAVRTDDNGDLGVDYARLVVPLVAAVITIDARLAAIEGSALAAVITTESRRR